jgi:hypothetical protein
MRITSLIASFFVALILLGCGGGGGGSNSNTGSKNLSSGTSPNSVSVYVDGGPIHNINMPFVTVRICAPGTSSCQDIDHVLVDTGSWGLRLVSSAVDPTLASALPAVQNSSGQALAECMQFVSSNTWGSVKQADVLLAGETASDIPIEIIGDPAYAVPAACNASGANVGTVADLGANGILGVGPFNEDCGQNCVNNSNNMIYYACSGSSCSPAITETTSQQVRNPAYAFAVDNNGVILNLPAVPLGGAQTVTGSLIFGIGTQANNALTAANVLTADAEGNIRTTYNSRTYSSFLDSGSNGFFIPDSTIPSCTRSTGFYCPLATLTLSAINQGSTGSTAPSTVSFNLENTDNLLNAHPTFFAYSTVGGYSSSSMFDWGLPFFYGREVYTAFNGRSTPAGNGPYFAY